MPLIFGTIKGTVYALLFAIPLAVLGALYTSQFVHPSIRAKIKPTVEIMAALPSVVIGFMAGLYLASVVERNLVAVMLMLPLHAAVRHVGRSRLDGCRARLTSDAAPAPELMLIVPLLLVGGWVATRDGADVEVWFFGGDARQWLSDDARPDLRPAQLPGRRHGDGFCGDPDHLHDLRRRVLERAVEPDRRVAGARRQPLADGGARGRCPRRAPASFRPIMVGFGRAVGETMIVLMATGNTPVMDWSIFNGIRTLSANIAVEIPEAPARRHAVPHAVPGRRRCCSS